MTTIIDALNEIKTKIAGLETTPAAGSDRTLLGILKAANGRVAAALSHIDGSQALKDIIAAGGTPGQQPADQPAERYDSAGGPG